MTAGCQKSTWRRSRSSLPVFLTEYWRVLSKTTGFASSYCTVSPPTVSSPWPERGMCVVSKKFCRSDLGSVEQPGGSREMMTCVEIKILRRVRAESHRRPPRHRRDACSMAWRCQFLAARPGSVERRVTGIATLSSRRRVDGVEDDAMIQHERTAKV